MKLFLVHCGYYDPQVADGIYEFHVNFFVVAESFADAKKKAKLIPEFKAKHMHIDGLQMIEAVDGHNVQLEAKAELLGQSTVISERYHELAKVNQPTV